MQICVQKNAIAGIIDYGQVMSCLNNYQAPHRKITVMLQRADLIRIKKGLYALGDRYRDVPLSLELIANLIYGPSYVSQEYALQYYGMIPERVEMITSMTNKRHKLFKTPFGTFQYRYINHKKFTVGVDWLEIRKNIFILMASPEKALADTISRYKDISDHSDLSSLLFEDLRIDEEALQHFNLNRLEKISEAYHNTTVSLLLTGLKIGL